MLKKHWVKYRRLINLLFSYFSKYSCLFCKIYAKFIRKCPWLIPVLMNGEAFKLHPAGIYLFRVNNVTEKYVWNLLKVNKDT